GGRVERVVPAAQAISPACPLLQGGQAPHGRHQHRRRRVCCGPRSFRPHPARAHCLWWSGAGSVACDQGRRSIAWPPVERIRNPRRARNSGTNSSAHQRPPWLCRLPARAGTIAAGEILVGTSGGRRMKIVGQAVPHESARGHVTGEALYTDDLLTRFPNLLHAWPVLAPHAHARLTKLVVIPAVGEPGVCATLTASDVPGEGDSGC